MKRSLLLFFLILLAIDKGFSQTDTIIIYKTDTVFVTEKQDIMYKMFVENKEAEIKRLWKMSLIDFSIPMPNIGLEQKLGKLFSIEGYLRFGFSNLPDFSISESKSFLFESESDPYLLFEFEQMFKYYFDINIRERKGLRTNGFSGTYFATSILYNRKEYSYFFNEITPTPRETNLNLGLKYGVQRRIGSYINFDIFIGLYYNYIWKKEQYKTEFGTRFHPIAGVRAGFAIDSFKNLKSRIKQ